MAVISKKLGGHWKKISVEYKSNTYTLYSATLVKNFLFGTDYIIGDNPYLCTSYLIPVDNYLTRLIIEEK